jgi:phosphoglycolate phosphatase
MKPIKAVIFDLDGTLLDTLEDLEASMNYVLKAYQYPIRTREEIRSFVGNGIRKLVERAAGFPDGIPRTEEGASIGAKIEQMFQDMSVYYEAHCKERTAPYAGITACLAGLKQEGIQMAVVSNKLDKAVKELVDLYFSEWISESAGDQPGMRTKPAPDTLFLVMERLGVSPEECIYVGDSDVDIQTAAHAGVPCISVCWGFRNREFLSEHGAKAFVDTPEELSAVLTTWQQVRRRQYQYLLFDLDGTLTNPAEGITKSVQYALADFGISAETKDLLCFIGPPLFDSFRDFYGFDKEQTERAIAKYRERYTETGIYENFAYEGIRELLKKLSAQGYRLGVATSKPEEMANRVLIKYGLKEWFDVVAGSKLDGTRSRKSEVIEEAIRRMEEREGSSINRRQVIMIGDRSFDVLGAEEVGVDSIGISYGFAEPGELEQAGADFVIRTVAELHAIFCGASDSSTQ